MKIEANPSDILKADLERVKKLLDYYEAVCRDINIKIKMAELSIKNNDCEELANAYMALQNILHRERT